jgi:hypothetical protein
MRNSKLRKNGKHRQRRNADAKNRSGLTGNTNEQRTKVESDALKKRAEELLYAMQTHSVTFSKAKAHRVRRACNNVLKDTRGNGDSREVNKAYSKYENIANEVQAALSTPWKSKGKYFNLPDVVEITYDNPTISNDKLVNTLTQGLKGLSGKPVMSVTATIQSEEAQKVFEEFFRSWSTDVGDEEDE